MKESIDEKSSKCHVISKHRPFLAFEWFTIFKAVEQIRPLLFSIVFDGLS